MKTRWKVEKLERWMGSRKLAIEVVVNWNVSARLRIEIILKQDGEDLRAWWNGNCKWRVVDKVINTHSTHNDRNRGYFAYGQI